MKIIKHIFLSILFLAILGSLFTFGVGKVQALCNYNLSENGCTITYDGTGISSTGGDCSPYTNEVEFAADGTVCATSPNSCDFSSCTAINTITRCQGGKCNNSQVVSHPWSVCSTSTASCTPTPTIYVPPPTVYVPPPTVYVPPPTTYVPPPTIYVCPVPAQVVNVVVVCPYCL